MRYAACVEYDGSSFSGWQTQKGNIRTVQCEVEKSLSKVADSEIMIVTAGRTDAGVHASHQIIHFDSDASRDIYSWCRGANRFLSKDVRLRWVQVADPEFHARFSALSRSYRYIIYNNPIHSAIYRNLASAEYKPLDVAKMSAAGNVLIGTHDFTSFRASGCQAHSPIRTMLNFEITRQGYWLWFDVTANAFLQHMVRNIAGSLIEIGSGKREIEWMTDVLNAKDRTRGGITAPANGLYLVGVEYPDSFDIKTSYQQVSYWGECNS